MTLSLRHSLPFTVVRGDAETLEADIYNVNAQQTPTVGTLTLKNGSKVILDAVAATSLGPPASYSLGATVLDAEPFCETLLAFWRLTIGGRVYGFRIPGILCRVKLYPVITDTDLTDQYPDIQELSDQANFSAQREAAWTRLNRDLIRKGNRPNLIIDSYQLFDSHVALTAAFVYRHYWSSIGDGKYKDLYLDLLKEYKGLFNEIQWRYDKTDANAAADSEKENATGILITHSPMG